MQPLMHCCFYIFCICTEETNLKRRSYIINGNSLVHHYYMLSLLNLLIIVEVDGCPASPSCITHVWPYLNFWIHSYILLCRSALSLYWDKNLWWISASNTPSNQRNWITALCSSLMPTASGVTMFTLKLQSKVTGLGSNFDYLTTMVPTII